MFYEFLVSAILSRYNLTCQPVDTSRDPLAMRVNKIKKTRVYYFEIMFPFSIPYIDGKCLLVVFLL